MDKNFFHIEEQVELSEIFCALSVLSEDGILLLMGISNVEIIEKLKEFEITDIEFPNIGKSFTFGIFKKYKEEHIAIRFNEKSKKDLIILSKKYIPNLEMCSYLYYLRDDKKEILEYIVDSDIYISRDSIDDKTVRYFCKQLNIHRYCLEDF